LSELCLGFTRRVEPRSSTLSSRYDTSKRGRSLLLGECLFACFTSDIDVVDGARSRQRAPIG
jgi:hypothetical protein